MWVYKFGGASIKDAEAVVRAGEIIKKGDVKQLLLVFSAMGKTTNALEQVCEACKTQREKGVELFNDVINDHLAVCEKLFEPDDAIFRTVKSLQNEFTDILQNKSTANFAYFYDRVVPAGELLSTLIVSRYLQATGCKNEWFDARELIKTDYNFTRAQVDQSKTQIQINAKLAPLLQQKNGPVVTQGFIAGADSLNPTTLGREGSDYSAALFAYFLNADSVTIWKDVPGVLNADPKYFDDTVLLKNISYREAVELAYYGASVIHPKTIQPLQEKNIPLYVKSFYQPDSEGSVINESTVDDDRVPSYIIRSNRRLISISPKDFSFVAETALSRIFELTGNHGITVDIMQNSAINFSICVNDHHPRIDEFTKALQNEFRVLFNRDLKLLTVRHYNDSTLKKLIGNNKVILEQRTRNTTRILYSEG